MWQVKAIKAQGKVTRYEIHDTNGKPMLCVDGQKWEHHDKTTANRVCKRANGGAEPNRKSCRESDDFLLAWR